MLVRWIAAAVASCLVAAFFCIAFVLIQAWVLHARFETAFEQTTPGESLNTVLERFGPPSDVGAQVPTGESTRHPPCQDKCFLRLWYMAPVVGGISPYSVDFDNRQRVVSKYHWHSP